MIARNKLGSGALGKVVEVGTGQNFGVATTYLPRGITSILARYRRLASVLAQNEIDPGKTPGLSRRNPGGR